MKKPQPKPQPSTRTLKVKKDALKDLSTRTRATAIKGGRLEQRSSGGGGTAT